MTTQLVETILVRRGKQIVVINKSDFDPATETLYTGEEPEAPEPTPPAPLTVEGVADLNREQLQAAGQKLCLKLDGRLSDSKLRAAIVDHLST